MAKRVRSKKPYGQRGAYGRQNIQLSELMFGDKFKFLNGRKTYTKQEPGQFIPRGVVVYSTSKGEMYFVERDKAQKIYVKQV